MLSRKLVFTALSIMMAFTLSAKKMTVLSISKGEMFDDTNKCEVALSESNGEKEGDMTISLTFGKKGWAGLDKPKKGSWSNFKKVYFNIYNPSDKPIEGFAFMIKGAKMTNTPENRKDWTFTLKPGKNELSVDLENVICNDGKTPLDVSRLLRWCFWNGEQDNVNVFVQKVWLDDGGKE